MLKSWIKGLGISRTKVPIPGRGYGFTGLSSAGKRRSSDSSLQGRPQERVHPDERREELKASNGVKGQRSKRGSAFPGEKPIAIGPGTGERKPTAIKASELGKKYEDGKISHLPAAFAVKAKPTSFAKGNWHERAVSKIREFGKVRGWTRIKHGYEETKFDRVLRAIAPDDFLVNAGIPRMMVIIGSADSIKTMESVKEYFRRLEGAGRKLRLSSADVGKLIEAKKEAEEINKIQGRIEAIAREIRDRRQSKGAKGKRRLFRILRKQDLEERGDEIMRLAKQRDARISRFLGDWKRNEISAALGTYMDIRMKGEQKVLDKVPDEKMGANEEYRKAAKEKVEEQIEHLRQVEEIQEIKRIPFKGLEK